MRARFGVVMKVASEGLPQRLPVPHNHVVQALPANGPDQSLHVWILPGRLRRRDHFLYPMPFATASLGLVQNTGQATACPPAVLPNRDAVGPRMESVDVVAERSHRRRCEARLHTYVARLGQKAMGLLSSLSASQLCRL